MCKCPFYSNEIHTKNTLRHVTATITTYTTFLTNMKKTLNICMR